MPKKIVLLTGKREKPYLLDFMQRTAPRVPCTAFTTKADFLKDASENGLADVRLISFLSSIIVPEDILSALTLVPYNIHPGPPSRPGLFPEAFAAVEKSVEYGVTVHEMVAQIDAGPIVAVENFRLPHNADRMTIVEEAEKRAVPMFAALAEFCATSDEALPHLEANWSGKCTTRQDYDRLLHDHPELAPR